MTINDLLKLCIEQIQKGNGNKTIYLSDDDEGNGYHEMYYGFSNEVKELDFYGTIKDPEDAIILG